MEKPENRQPVQLPPEYYIQMQQAMQEDEVDLFELWQILWDKRKIIIILSLAVGITAAGISLLMPNYYKAEVVMAPTSEKKSSSSLSASLGGLGGLASMAGISIGGGENIEQNLAILNSREFLWGFIKEKQLLPLLFEDEWDNEKKTWIKSEIEDQPSLWDGYRLFTKSILSISTDKKSDIVTLSIEWTDPVLAAEWANHLIERLNIYLRNQAIQRTQQNLTYLNSELKKIEVADMRQTLFELISNEQKTAMLANTQSEFAFRVIDKAVEPDKKSKPKRALISVLATLMGGFLAVLIVFIKRAIKKRNEEENG